jgi:hypothetical protein
MLVVSTRHILAAAHGIQHLSDGKRLVHCERVGASVMSRSAVHALRMMQNNVDGL